MSSSPEWTEEDSFEARLAYVMESDDYPTTGCCRTRGCPCPVQALAAPEAPPHPEGRQ